MENIKKEIEKAQKILLISHVNPDGDTLGSMCALKLFIGDKADMLVQTRVGQEIPEIYEFLPEIKTAKTLRNVQNIYDLVITLDVASIDRMVLEGRKIFENAPMTINIDHHKTNNGYGKINVIDSNASSCGEVLFDIFDSWGVEITKDMATCLYVAIMTDTGCFRYDNTAAKTLNIASKLTQYGASAFEISNKVYDSKAKAMVLFHAFCVSNTKFLENNKVAYTIIRNADMARFNAKHEHTEGICETIRSIKDVEIAFVAKENDNNTTKISLRSKGLDVTKVTDVFKGGGHPSSAGCTINKPVNIAVEKLIEEIKKIL